MRRAPWLLLLIVALVTSACAQSELTISDDSDTAGARILGPDFGSDVLVTDPDAVVELALDDLEVYWAEILVDVYGVDLEPLVGGYVPYGPTTPIPQCGPAPIDYDEIAENALYCPAEDLIAWDRVALIPDLQARFGSLTVGLVMAHEFAHAIQARGDVLGATVTLELQADCFAGAWVADVDDRIRTFDTSADALDQAVAGLLELRDSLGVSGLDATAHGSGFDRVSAFQDGFEQGPEICATYEDEPPTVVAIPFGSRTDQRQGGNLPLDLLFEPLVADLESFFTTLFDELGQRWEPIGGFEAYDPADGPITCGDETISGPSLEFGSFYCVPDSTAYMDAVGLLPALDEIGDFAFGGELARLYAFAAQDQLGLGGDDPVTEGLHADCLTGVYAAAEFVQQIPDQQLVLSPGDLDEIIIAFLAFGGDTEASAFERTAAFRAGFLDGVERCEPLLG